MYDETNTTFGIEGKNASNIVGILVHLQQPPYPPPIPPPRIR